MGGTPPGASCPRGALATAHRQSMPAHAEAGQPACGSDADAALYPLHSSAFAVAAPPAHAPAHASARGAATSTLAAGGTLGSLPVPAPSHRQAAAPVSITGAKHSEVLVCSACGGLVDPHGTRGGCVSFSRSDQQASMDTTATTGASLALAASQHERELSALTNNSSQHGAAAAPGDPLCMRCLSALAQLGHYAAGAGSTQPLTSWESAPAALQQQLSDACSAAHRQASGWASPLECAASAAISSDGIAAPAAGGACVPSPGGGTKRSSRSMRQLSAWLRRRLHKLALPPGL